MSSCGPPRSYNADDDNYDNDYDFDDDEAGVGGMGGIGCGPFGNVVRGAPALADGGSDLGAETGASSTWVRTGFRNPWPSAVKPTLAQVWAGLEWGEDRDPCIPLAVEAARTLVDRTPAPASADLDAKYRDDNEGNDEDEDGEIEDTLFNQQHLGAAGIDDQTARRTADTLLRRVAPDFTIPDGVRSKTTWLGHASVLRPIRILIDPIFSTRCSPTQVAGPYRSYAAPCAVQDLPPIDVVLISHNHYDHLDLSTVAELWRRNRASLRFVVPLGNRQWFLAPDQSGGFGVDPDRVVELDWWESICLRFAGGEGVGDEEDGEGEADEEGEGEEEEEGQGQVEITCTPAQHGSGRVGLDANVSLWSSWYISSSSSSPPLIADQSSPDGNGKGAIGSHRIFFAGDTGFQMHTSPHYPPCPSPSPSSAHTIDIDIDEAEREQEREGEGEGEGGAATCPAFDEIRTRLGRPHVSLLPVSVGATLSFVRSYVPLSDRFSPLPRIKPGLTGGNHATPWDALRIFDILTNPPKRQHHQEHNDQGDAEEYVAVAIHWGTFVSGPLEVVKTVGNTLWACQAQHVRLRLGDDALLHEPRSNDDDTDDDGQKGDGPASPNRSRRHRHEGAKRTFRILDHGGSVSL
ncbi:uncharacterized protein PFL1_01859 [Pseudozyma flocculosa PF-1]|uniref:Metallo-beta-lactamase domain-containing protein n=1 Tax=Pseudozyma flocculosa TaxID=84751 RepID=A0A5C3EYQ1_9BASI|nr:uncharacterized protein PFL1_01859 [Pseudozyma flocculosa PF-1]EPQ30333.1 hypothetical protein PFL1_01859 [Pseudozyma flocculosa PF-1]SPO37403.1 uncharacterized protein PSFLO_02876 [Pseudozyma flocculosa]